MNRDIYAKPSNSYEKFVNAFKRRNPHWGNKKVVTDANKLWKIIKTDPAKVEEYIASAPKFKDEKKQTKISFAKIPERSVASPSSQTDFAVEVIPAVHQKSSLASSSTSLFPNASTIALNEAQFHREFAGKLTEEFLLFILDNNALADVFMKDEAVWKEDIFRTTCESIAKSWAVFNQLRSQYQSMVINERTGSKISKWFAEVAKNETALKEQFEAISAIKTSPAVGITELVQSAAEKQKLILNSVKTLLTLQGKITTKDFLNSLRRRISQMMETKTFLNASKTEVTITCLNNSTLCWETALGDLIELENGFVPVEHGRGKRYLTTSELITVGNLVKDSTAISEQELSFYLPSRLKSQAFINNILKQLLKHFPVLLLHKKNEKYLINMHQLGFGSDALDALFNNKQPEDKIPEAEEREAIGAGREGGRKSILDKFPDIPIIATEFIKANGYKAQERRRDTTVTSCGVSVSDVRNHLLENVPGLKDHGLSETTVRYLFRPKKKGTLTAERYKCVIDASVPRKDNSFRKDNMDAHYLLSRIKLRREMAAYFPDEWSVLSVDSMNKIRYGTLAVSRYHQIRKIYMADDKPKYLDHDFPLPYKTIPDGIMILTKQDNDDFFLEDSYLNASVYNGGKLTELEAKIDTIADQRKRLEKALFRAAYTLEDETVDIFKSISELPSAEIIKSKEGLQKMLFEELFQKEIDERELLSSETLDKALSYLGLKYQVKFVLYNGIEVKPKVIGQTLCPKHLIVKAAYFDGSSWCFFHLSKVDDPEHLQTCGGIEIMEDTNLDTNQDKSGRDHVNYPHSGPSLVYLRNNFFHGNTCLEHINDLFPICRESVKKGKTIMTLLADGGPDYNPNGYKNELLYAELWKRSGLDQLSVMCNAAGWSAMNPIEHLWSPLSSSLTSVILDYSFRDDGVPPCNDTKIDADEKKRQNKKLLDQGAQDIAAYWSSVTFDGFPVVPLPVSSDGREDAFKTSAYVEDFVNSPIRDIKSGKHHEALELLRFTALHADRRKNEFILRKCQFIADRIPCVHCQNYPVRAQKVLDVVKAAGCLFEPTPSPVLEGHYMTFLEMLNATDRSNFAKPNEGLPSGSIGNCEVCPSWQFSSVTEARRHVSILHPKYQKKDLLKSVAPKEFSCKVKDCGMVFPTQHRLNDHKRMENHYIRKKKQDATTKQTGIKRRGDSIKSSIKRFFDPKSVISAHEEAETDVESAANDENDDTWVCEWCNGEWCDDDDNRWVVCDSCDGKYHLQCSGIQYEEECYYDICLDDTTFLCDVCKD